MTPLGLALPLLVAGFVALALLFRALDWKSPVVAILAGTFVPVAMIAGIALILAPALPVSPPVHINP